MTGVRGTRLAPGERARITFSLEILGGGPHTFQAVSVAYEQGGERHTQTMAFALVACPAPATTCEIPSDWEASASSTAASAGRAAVPRRSSAVMWRRGGSGTTRA